MNLVQHAKNRLVALGPGHRLVRLALRLHGIRHGYRVAFGEGKIAIKKATRTMILRDRDYTLIPIMMEDFDSFFEKIDAKPSGGRAVLDFSAPGSHRYLKWGVELVFPGIAEDDSIEAYTFKFKPRDGMVVFDVGAHAGLTTCFLSRMVGDAGRVYALEPDDTARRFLMQNKDRLGLNNTTVLDVALGDRTGRAVFNMDGSMGAGLVEYVIYPDTGERREVEVLTIEACCDRLGCIPDFIKMDIEGAEVGVIRSSLDFLKRNPIHFAFDSYHRTKDGSLTCYELERLFRSIGYIAESSDAFGEMFTWAAPPAGL
jgi:FkbM family methyltransferase